MDQRNGLVDYLKGMMGTKGNIGPILLSRRANPMDWALIMAMSFVVGSPSNQTGVFANITGQSPLSIHWCLHARVPVGKEKESTFQRNEWQQSAVNFAHQAQWCAGCAQYAAKQSNRYPKEVGHLAAGFVADE
jgi:hypothetical protein